MRNNKINDIEILRSLAVLLVILEHLHHLFPWLKVNDPLHIVTSFWGGVDIFFAISGLGNYSWQLGLLALVLTLFLSDLNFRFIENPLRRRGARVAQNTRQSIENAVATAR